MDVEETAFRTLSIFNTGDGTLTWNVSVDEPWITVSPANGTNSGDVTINVNTAGLNPGSYTGNIIVTSNGGTKTGSVNLNIPPIITPTITSTVTSSPTETPISLTPTPTFTIEVTTPNPTIENLNTANI